MFPPSAFVSAPPAIARNIIESMRLLSYGVLILVGLLCLAGLSVSWSPSGWCELIAVALLASAGLATNLGARRLVRALGALVIVVTLTVRWVAADRGQTRLITLPRAPSARWLARTFDEQDIALIGARLLPLLWRLPPDERRQLVPSLESAYASMRRDSGLVASPVIDTLLSRQEPRAFDTVVIEPTNGAQPRAGVLFLHGFAGSFTLECWLVSAAARAIGAVTVCPATEFSGHWNSRDATRIIEVSLDYLRSRGVERVYLAGLSNGGAGAGVFAAQRPSSLSGAILISGTPATGAIERLPTLVIHGRHDTIASAATASAFAARSHARYVAFDGGHFVLMEHHGEVRQAIADWLTEREQKR
jgi:hypothetical protein